MGWKRGVEKKCRGVEKGGEEECEGGGEGRRQERLARLLIYLTAG